MTTPTEFPFGENSQAIRLARLLRQIQDEEFLFAEIRTQHKARMETLHNEAYRLKDEILSGQLTLIPPVEDGKSKAAGEP